MKKNLNICSENGTKTKFLTQYFKINSNFFFRALRYHITLF